jgi:hypothetical protein
VLHLHDFNHVKIDRFPPLVYGIYERFSQNISTPESRKAVSCTFRGRGRPDSHHCIDDGFGELLGQGGAEFSSKGRLRQIDEGWAV